MSRRNSNSFECECNGKCSSSFLKSYGIATLKVGYSHLKNKITAQMFQRRMRPSIQRSVSDDFKEIEVFLPEWVGIVVWIKIHYLFVPRENCKFFYALTSNGFSFN